MSKTRRRRAVPERATRVPAPSSKARATKCSVFDFLNWRRTPRQKTSRRMARSRQVRLPGTACRRRAWVGRAPTEKKPQSRNASQVSVAQALLPVRRSLSRNPSDLSLPAKSHSIIARGQAEACPTKPTQSRSSQASESQLCFYAGTGVIFTSRLTADACTTGEPHAIRNTRARRTIARDIRVLTVAHRRARRAATTRHR